MWSTLQVVSIWLLFEYIDHFSTTKLGMFCCRESFLKASYFVDLRFSLQYSGHNLDLRLRFPQLLRQSSLWFVQSTQSSKLVHIDLHCSYSASQSHCAEDKCRVAAKQMMTSRKNAFFIWNKEHILISKLLSSILAYFVLISNRSRRL